MKGLVGKTVVAGMFIVFTSLALAIGVDATKLTYGTEMQVITSNLELSYLGSNAPETGIVLLLSLGLVGLLYARRRSS